MPQQRCGGAFGIKETGCRVKRPAARLCPIQETPPKAEVQGNGAGGNVPACSFHGDFSASNALADSGYACGLPGVCAYSNEIMAAARGAARDRPCWHSYACVRCR